MSPQAVPGSDGERQVCPLFPEPVSEKGEYLYADLISRFQLYRMRPGPRGALERVKVPIGHFKRGDGSVLEIDQYRTTEDELEEHFGGGRYYLEAYGQNGKLLPGGRTLRWDGPERKPWTRVPPPQPPGRNGGGGYGPQGYGDGWDGGGVGGGYGDGWDSPDGDGGGDEGGEEDGPPPPRGRGGPGRYGAYYADPHAGARFDPMTGAPLGVPPGARFDPMTGAPLPAAGAGGGAADPAVLRMIENQNKSIEAMQGLVERTIAQVRRDGDAKQDTTLGFAREMHGMSLSQHGDAVRSRDEKIALLETRILEIKEGQTARLDELRATLKGAAETEVRALKGEVARLETALAEAQTDVRARRLELATAQSQGALDLNKRLQEATDRYGAQIASMRAEHERAFEDQRKRLQGHIDDLETRLKRARDDGFDREDDLVKENVELRRSIADGPPPAEPPPPPPPSGSADGTPWWGNVLKSWGAPFATALATYLTAPRGPGGVPGGVLNPFGAGPGMPPGAPAPGMAGLPPNPYAAPPQPPPGFATMPAGGAPPYYGAPPAAPPPYAPPPYAPPPPPPYAPPAAPPYARPPPAAAAAAAPPPQGTAVSRPSSRSSFRYVAEIQIPTYTAAAPPGGAVPPPTAGFAASAPRSPPPPAPLDDAGDADGEADDGEEEDDDAGPPLATDGAAPLGGGRPPPR